MARLKLENGKRALTSIAQMGKGFPSWVIIISSITVFTGVLFVHQPAQTINLEHQSLKSIIMLIH